MQTYIIGNGIKHFKSNSKSVQLRQTNIVHKTSIVLTGLNCLALAHLKMAMRTTTVVMTARTMMMGMTAFFFKLSSAAKVLVLHSSMMLFLGGVGGAKLNKLTMKVLNGKMIKLNSENAWETVICLLVYWNENKSRQEKVSMP